MAKKRISRKEIKQPDEFITFWTRTISYFELHRQAFIFIIAGSIVTGALIWGGIAYWEKRERDAAQVFAKAQNLLLGHKEGATSRDVKDTDTENREKAKGILKDVIAKYKRSKASQMSRILLANLYYQSQDYENSIQLYESFLKTLPRDPILEALAFEGLGYSYEQKKDYEKALIYYQKLVDSKVEFLHEGGLLGLARCYELENNIEKALETYRGFLSAYPQHAKAEEARSHVARLSSLSSKPKPPVTQGTQEGGEVTGR